MPVYAVKDSVSVRGDLTVHGNLISVRSQDTFARLDHPGLISLSDVVGSEHAGHLVLDGSLMVLAFPRNGEGPPPVFAVRGCIKARAEVILD